MSTVFQEAIYKFIAAYIAQYQASPSFSELTAAMSISPNSKSLITRSLRALEKEGKLILRKDGRRLLISINSKHLHLLGRISAGNPIEAISDDQYIDVEKLVYGLNRFALHVKGNSMIEEGIFDGDLVICRSASTANENDIVVALIDQNTTTIKKISFKTKGMVTLIPANKDLTAKVYLPERISIQGIYIGLIRMHS